MERPAKRLRIADPDIRNPRDTGSRMTEGLFTSELGIQGENMQRELRATRTISLSDFQRRNIYGEYERVPRPALPRRNAAIYLRPRAPDATVTANVVEINLKNGTTTSKVTEVPAGSSATVVSLSNVGSATVPITVPGVSSTTGTATASTSDSSQNTITPPPTSSTSGVTTSTTTGSTSTGSFLSETLTNSTTSFAETTSTEGRTVTVTATSTFEISLINGTIIAPGPNSQVPITATDDFTESSTTATFTFGELLTTSTLATDSSGFYGSTGTLSDYYPGLAATGVAGSPTTSAAATSSSSSADSGPSPPGLTPVQQQVVGGVVGGVAGIAVILVILLVVLRWYRRRLKARGQLPEQIAAREIAGGPGNSYPMSQRSSNVPFAATVAHNLKRLRPHSNLTVATTNTNYTDLDVRESERGFQRIAGRKIAPVLGSGGDPYGGNYGAFEKDTLAGPSDPLQNPDRGLSGASFYRDSGGFYGGKGDHSPTFPPSPTTAAAFARSGELPASPGYSPSASNFPGSARSGQNSSQISLTAPSRPEGIAIMRPSPARTPITLSPAASSIRLPIQQPLTLDEHAPPLPTGLSVPGLAQRDGVGRSLASQDGSRVSRSSGRSAGRFVENI